MRAIKTALTVVLGLVANFLLSSCEYSESGTNYGGPVYRIYSTSVSRASYSTNIRYLLIYKGESPSDRLIVLFPGGTGTCHFGFTSERSACSKTPRNSIDIGADIWVSYNFLARTARDFGLRGHTVILMDMPDDVKKRMSVDSRGAKVVASAYRVGGDWDGDSQNEVLDAVEDIKAVVQDVETTFSFTITDIYLVGTSRGTLSAAYLSHNLQGVRGVVLTSTVSSDTSNFPIYCPSYTDNFAECTGLNSYSGRLLVIHHESDGCSVSSFSSARDLFDSLTVSPKSFTRVMGGLNLSSNPCKAKTYHGFYGLDAEVVGLILDWIEGKPVPPSL